MPGRLAIYDDSVFKKDCFETLKIFKDNIKVLDKKYNIAPTINIPVFLNTAKYTYAHFGLIPSWANDKKSININARSETIFEKKSFRESFKTKRCLIPVNGYYEWKNGIAHFIKPKKNSYFVFAGIYDIWFDNNLKQNILSVALITTEPNDTIKTLHDRMPVLLDKKDWKLWLSKNSSFEELNQIMKPSKNESIEFYEVSNLVNSVKNNSIECIESFKKEQMVQQSLF